MKAKGAERGEIVKKKHTKLWILILVVIGIVIATISKPSETTEAVSPTPEPMQAMTPVPVTDWEIITREGHPTYYGSMTLAHSVWSDVERGKIIFSDEYERWSDESIMSIESYKGSDLIRGIEVSVSNCQPAVVISLEELLPVVATYMPFDILDVYYVYDGSALIRPKIVGEKDDCYYTIRYVLTDAASEAYYSNEHEYSGSLDVIIRTDTENHVRSFQIQFGRPRWMSSLDQNGMQSVEWECDLYNYQS